MSKSRLKTIAPRMKPVAPKFGYVSLGKDEWLRRRELYEPRRAWYRGKRWRALRLLALQRDGHCCVQTGVPLVGKYPAWNSPAVDHIEPHGWDERLFFNLDNLQSVTKQWHDRTKQAMERRA